MNTRHRSSGNYNYDQQTRYIRSPVMTVNHISMEGTHMMSTMERTQITTAGTTSDNLPTAAVTKPWLDDLGVTFTLLVLCPASAYIVLATLTSFHLAYLSYAVKRQRIRNVSYHLGLTLLIVLLCGCRVFYLLYVPYGSTKRLGRLPSVLLENISYPTLTSAFQLLTMPLLRMTRLVGPRKRVIYICAVLLLILINFAVAVGADTVIYLYNEFYFLRLIRTAYFTLWSLIFLLAYITVMVRLFKAWSKARRPSPEMSIPVVVTPSSIKMHTLQVPGPVASTSRAQPPHIRKRHHPRRTPAAVKVASIVTLLFVTHSVIKLWNVITQPTTSVDGSTMKTELSLHLVEFLLATIMISVSALAIYR